MFRSPVPHVPRETWIVSSRHAPQIDECCSVVCNSQRGRCYRAPIAALEVFRRDANGCLHRSNLDALRASLDPTRPTVLFTHGSFITFDYFAKESPRTAQYFECGAGRPLNCVFFTWPSDGCVPTCAAAVRIRERRARTNAFYLAELLHLVPPPQPGAPVVFASHSHGGEMVAATLHLLAGGTVAARRLGNPSPTRPRALLFAPAMDNNDFAPGQAFSRALYATPAMALVYSRKDVATTLYPLRRPLAGLALGRTGLTARQTAKIGPVANRVCNVDVTRSVGHQHVWSSYLSRPNVVTMVRSYFQ